MSVGREFSLFRKLEEERFHWMQLCDAPDYPAAAAVSVEHSWSLLTSASRADRLFHYWPIPAAPSLFWTPSDCCWTVAKTSFDPYWKSLLQTTTSLLFVTVMNTRRRLLLVPLLNDPAAPSPPLKSSSHRAGRPHWLMPSATPALPENKKSITQYSI